MAKVVFIELPVARKTRYICDLVEKLYGSGKKIHVIAAEQKTLYQLDRELWTWKPDSFIPHKIIQNGTENNSEPEEKVLLYSKVPAQPADVLIMHDPVPVSQIENYPLIIDFAELYDQTRLQQSRKRYVAFRDSGAFELEVHKLGAFLQSK